MIKPKIKVTDRDVLLIVDVQMDFLPGGALPVHEGDQVIPVINRISPLFNRVFYTVDAHPSDHTSFSKWPPHCVIGTPGAEISQELTAVGIIIHKGYYPGEDGYSGFESGELEYVLSSGPPVGSIFVVGLALDYCVKATALDSRRHGYDTYVVGDATKTIERTSRLHVYDDLDAAGVHLVYSNEMTGED